MQVWGGADCTHQRDEAWRMRDSRGAGGRAVVGMELMTVGGQRTTRNVESTVPSNNTTTFSSANEVGFGTAAVPDKSSRQEPCRVLYSYGRSLRTTNLCLCLPSSHHSFLLLYYSSVSLSFSFSFSISLSTLLLLLPPSSISGSPLLALLCLSFPFPASFNS